MNAKNANKNKVYILKTPAQLITGLSFTISLTSEEILFSGKAPENFETERTIVREYSKFSEQRRQGTKDLYLETCSTNLSILQV
jgi:hypothetical protein